MLYKVKQKCCDALLTSLLARHELVLIMESFERLLRFNDHSRLSFPHINRRLAMKALKAHRGVTVYPEI